MHRSPSKSDVVNQSHIRRSARRTDDYVLGKYRTHVNDYLQRIPDKNPYSLRAKYPPAPGGHQRHALLESSPRYARRGKRAHFGFGMGGGTSPASRKVYPTRLEVDKYFDLVSTIEVQRDKLLNSVTTVKDRLKGHFRGRNKSVVTSGAGGHQNEGSMMQGSPRDSRLLPGGQQNASSGLGAAGLRVLEPGYPSPSGVNDQGPPRRNTKLTIQTMSSRARGDSVEGQSPSALLRGGESATLRSGGFGNEDGEQGAGAAAKGSLFSTLANRRKSGQYTIHEEQDGEDSRTRTYAEANTNNDGTLNN